MADIFGIKSFLIEGNPLEPCASDLLAQTALLNVGLPVPDGWRVLTGNPHSSQIARVVGRWELEEDEEEDEEEESCWIHRQPVSRCPDDCDHGVGTVKCSRCGESGHTADELRCHGDSK